MKKLKHLITNKKYICNWACGTTKEKSTRNEEEVTCKNCLRILKKKRVYVQSKKFQNDVRKTT